MVEIIPFIKGIKLLAEEIILTLNKHNFIGQAAFKHSLKVRICYLLANY